MALIVVAGAALMRAPLRSLVSLVTESEYYSHIAVIPLISVYLLYNHRQEIFAAISFSRAALAAVLPLAVAMAIVGQAGLGALPAPTVLAVAILFGVLFVLAAFALCFGHDAFRKAAFPLFFLLLAVPLPQSILQPVVTLLQVGSTALSAAIFRLLGIPFFRDGFTLAFPTLTIEVARECSSIRSSTAMVVMIILIGHMLLRQARTRLLLLLALPVVILTNAIRIVTLVLLTLYVDPNFLSSKLHKRGGILFFLLGLAMVVAFASLLKRFEPQEPASD